METFSGWVPVPFPERPVPRPSQIASRVPLPQRRRSPEDPIHTAYQERMLDALDSNYAGHFQLANPIYKIAKEECGKPNAHVAWSWLVDDRKERQFKVYMQLLSLPKILLRSLIRNTLPYDFVHDKNVEAAANKYMSVTNMPGIYCQAIATKRGLFGQSQDVGKGWSRDQVEKLCADIDLYLEDNQRGDQWGLQVDKRIPTNIKRYQELADDPKNRRYCANSRRAEQRRTLMEWKDLLRSQQSFDSTSRLDGAEHSVRARMEVGWSIDQSVRLKEHQDNAQTTHVWGLGQALSRLNWPGEYGRPYQWSLFRVWGRDQHLAQLSEHLGSVLCSAYTWEGGFNCTEAGTISFKDGIKAAVNAPSWDENGREIFITRQRTMQRLDKDLQELRDLSKKVHALPTEAALRQKEEEVKKLQAEAVEALEPYYEIVADTERMRDEIAQLKQRIAKAQEPNPAAVAREAALARAREHLAKLQRANPVTGPAELTSSRVPETPRDKDIANVSPVTSTSAPQVGVSPVVDDDKEILTNVTTNPSFQSSSPFIPRSS